MAAVEHACIHEHVERVLVSLEMELVARAAVEGTPLVGTDLRAQVLVAEKGERAPRRGAAPEVEMDRPLALPAEMQAAGGVEERRQLGQPIAAPGRRDPRELLPHVLRRDHAASPVTPSSASNRRLTATPALP